jgi:hypothetical protein
MFRFIKLFSKKFYRVMLNSLLTIVLVGVVLYLLYDKYLDKTKLLKKLEELVEKKEHFAPIIQPQINLKSMKLRIPKKQLKELFANNSKPKKTKKTKKTKTESRQSEAGYWESFNIQNLKNEHELAEAEKQLYENMISNENADHYAAINQSLLRDGIWN